MTSVTTWRERTVIRILLLVAKIAGRGLPEDVMKDIDSLATHINVSTYTRAEAPDA